MSILDALLGRPQKAVIETVQKAVTGPGAAIMTWGTPIYDVARDDSRIIRDALTVYKTNRWVNRAEGVISQRVGGVAWHLETDDGEKVTDESPPELRAIRDLLEKPLGDEFARRYPQQPATRRSLWGITSRHMGLANVGFWHLNERNAAADFPAQIFYIRPDRLTPETTAGVLTGWTLDKHGETGGTALSIEEVLPFYLDQPDKGYFGTGLPQSIWSSLSLPTSIDGHALDTLASGGRLPGIYAPKEAAGSDVFDRLTTDLRTIKDMPDSAKRDVVARAPIEFTPTAADMASLNVIALAQMSRDDTLTHWGVPLSTIGGAAPTGMNSGETRKYDEAALWQNAVQFRIDALYETIQYRLLDRLAAIGISVRLVIEAPAFDDEAPRYDLLNKASVLPMTNMERRAIIGLPPFGVPALDNAIVMPMQIVEYGTSVSSRPEDDIPLEGAQADVAKAKLPAAGLARMEKDLRRFLDEQSREIAAKVKAKAGHLAKKPGDTSVWWNAAEWDRRLERVLRPYAALIADQTAKTVQGQLGTGKAGEFADLMGNRVLLRMYGQMGRRITGINETTRDKVNVAIREGIEAGDGAAALGERVESAAAFDEYRAELIARTESAIVLNQSQIESFREFGVEKVRAIDGDQDPECAARDGQEFDIDEALSITDHPNGTLDWSPVISSSGKADTEEQMPSQKATATWGIPQITVPLTVQMPEIPATVVNVPAPIVNVEAPHAPVVNVTAPEPVVVPAPIVNIEAPQAAQKAEVEGPMDVRVVEMPDRMLKSRKIVKRDPQGFISEVDETSLEETA